VFRIDGTHGKSGGDVHLNADFLLPLRQGIDGYKIPPGETVYTCFSSDFLLEEADEWRTEAWRMMRLRSDLHFIFFTKRIERLEAQLPDDWGDGYPDRGYGGMFYEWLFPLDESEMGPYNSYGNGAGMRVSPCGYIARTLDEALDLAKQSAEVTHNHPEGIKGAQAIASAIFLARQHTPKEEIRQYIEQTFGYDLQRTCDDIRPTYEFDETCQGSCPEAIIAFLDSTDYESAIRLAISLGGDSDTIACMTGGIAAAYYGIPDWMIEKAVKYLPNDMIEIINRFDGRELTKK
jgi:ADP-ribosylglycohydrolase